MLIRIEQFEIDTNLMSYLLLRIPLVGEFFIGGGDAPAIFTPWRDCERYGMTKAFEEAQDV